MRDYVRSIRKDDHPYCRTWSRARTGACAGGHVFSSPLGLRLGTSQFDEPLNATFRRSPCRCMVNDRGEGMTGVGGSTPELLPDGRIRLHEAWHLTSGDGSRGISVLEEGR